MKRIKLYLDKVLDYCDEPTVFLARDDYDTMYLCIVGVEEMQYLAVKVAKSMLEKLLNGEIDVRSVFEQGLNDDACWVVDIEDNKLYKSTNPYVGDYDDFLPDPGYILSVDPTEKFTVTVPKSDQGLFRSIVKRFGWIAM